MTQERDQVLAAEMRKRAASCRKLSEASTRWLDKARLDGKAEAYDHAAEIVLCEPHDQGPEVQL